MEGFNRPERGFKHQHFVVEQRHADLTKQNSDVVDHWFCDLTCRPPNIPQQVVISNQNHHVLINPPVLDLGRTWNSMELLQPARIIAYL